MIFKEWSQHFTDPSDGLRAIRVDKVCKLRECAQDAWCVGKAGQEADGGEDRALGTMSAHPVSVSPFSRSK